VGQKVNPLGMRLGIVRDWDSRWFANRDNYASFLHEDIRIRKFLQEKYNHAGIDRIEIERAATRVKITIHTPRPGIVIGPKGSEIVAAEKDLADLTQKQVKLLVHEIKKPELSAQLVAENVANQLLRRISFRRAMKKAIQNTMRLGAKGIKLRVSGRLNGAEIARTEPAHEGSVPLHTLRADIDYGFAISHTTYGCIGVKCWIYHGEMVAGGQAASGSEAAQRRRERAPSRGGSK